MSNNKSTKLTVKADSRGYAYLGKLEGAPDFKALKKVSMKGEIGTPDRQISFDGDEKAGNMLKRGYVAIGANKEAVVEFKKNGIVLSAK